MSSFTKESVSYSTEQIAMTLAAIAYADEIIGTTIEDLLKESSLATQDNWKLTWGPHKKETSQAYVVQNQTNTDQYALAIRGTAPCDPFSWLLDFETKLVNMPWTGAPANAQISEGMAKIYDHLRTVPLLGHKLDKFLGSIADGSTLIVTGHSQGGAAASMMALWAAKAFPKLDVQPYTFAGETAGNDAFAKAFSDAFSTKPGGRYVNEYDVVPLAYSDLLKLPVLYASESITLPEHLENWVNNNLGLMEDYAQPLTATVLAKSKLYPRNPDQSCQKPDREFLEEAGAQHDHIRYLWSMDAPYTAIDDSWSPPTHLKH